MRGLRVLSDRSFGDLFAPVFGSLNQRQWLTGTDAFAYPGSWIDESEYDEQRDRYLRGPIAEFEALVPRVEQGAVYYGHSSVASLFPKYAELVSEDWSSLFALNREVADPLTWFQAYFEATERALYLEGFCEAVFLNVDGAFWEFYAARPSLLAQCAGDLAQREIRCEGRDLSECSSYL
jgi:hypothetical protein